MKSEVFELKEVLQVTLQHLQKHQHLKNNSQHKVIQLLVLNKNINHHNLAAMMMKHFQILFQWLKLLRQKLQNLFQRNQNLAQVKSSFVYSPSARY